MIQYYCIVIVALLLVMVFVIAVVAVVFRCRGRFRRCSCCIFFFFVLLPARFDLFLLGSHCRCFFPSLPHASPFMRSVFLVLFPNPTIVVDNAFFSIVGLPAYALLCSRTCGPPMIERFDHERKCTTKCFWRVRTKETPRWASPFFTYVIELPQTAVTCWTHRSTRCRAYLCYIQPLPHGLHPFRVRFHAFLAIHSFA